MQKTDKKAIFGIDVKKGKNNKKSSSQRHIKKRSKALILLRCTQK
jgi:hypothetical protein